MPTSVLRTRALALVCSVTLLGGIAACSGDQGDAKETTTRKVRYAIGTATPTAQQAPFFSLPQELGFWKEEGLDVELQGLVGTTAIVQSIETNHTDIGNAGFGSIYPAIAAGSDLRAFYNYTTGMFIYPAVRDDSPIKTLADLDGKTLGVTSLDGGTVPVIKAYYAAGGGDASKIKLVAVGTGADAASALKSGRVDALGMYDSVYAVLEQRFGMTLRTLTDSRFQDAGFEGGAFASQKTIDKDPKVITGIGRGIAKASIFAEENPTCAVRLHWKAFPESKPSGVAEDVALKEAILLLETRAKTAAPVGGEWGSATETGINASQKIIVDGGSIKALLPVDKVWNGSLVKSFNDFDQAKLRTWAKGYTC